jgi:uncharacterized OB-fold protein
MPNERVPPLGVLKHGLGYDLLAVEQQKRIVIGIRCHTCGQTSFHPKDINERYCGACHVFHEDGLLSHEG